MTNEDQLTWQQVDEYGTQVNSLRLGDKFVTVLAKGPSGWEEVVGEIVYKGVGSVTVAITGRGDHLVWAPETRVIKL
jgi:hypothetical protein